MGLETRVRRVELKRLRLLDLNARYMPPREFEQLVANLRADGTLTSTPTVAAAGRSPLNKESKPDDLEVLSGNNRVRAALAAEIADADVLEIISDLTMPQKIAVQLSHNRLSGADDVSTLIELYSQLDFDAKKYSGLTDDDFTIQPIDLASLSVGAPTYQQITLAFLPEDHARFKEAIETLAKDKRTAFYLARLTDFEAVFGAVVDTKKIKNIQNTAMALLAMAELARRQLASEAEA